MNILSIETSCDETAISVVTATGDFPHAHYEVAGNAIFSQIDIHQEYGGVFPNVAKREHIVTVVPMLEKALRAARLETNETTPRSPSQKEKGLLLAKLNRLGMLEQDSALEDVLGITPENILDRRLQTQVYLQGLSSTVKQARQLIVHGHIAVDGAVTRVPGMTVTKLQEKNISYSPNSGLNSDLHPVRPGAKDTYSDDSDDEVTKKTIVEKESKVVKEEESKVVETKSSDVNEKTTKEETTKKSGDKK